MTSPVQWEFPREDIRWVGPIAVTDSNVPTTGFQVTVHSSAARPTVWLAPDAEPGGTALGVRVGLGTSWPQTTASGLYLIRARIVDADETESVVVGQIRTT